jgi:hypothetical protein
VGQHCGTSLRPLTLPSSRAGATLPGAAYTKERTQQRFRAPFHYEEREITQTGSGQTLLNSRERKLKTERACGYVPQAVRGWMVLRRHADRSRHRIRPPLQSGHHRGVRRAVRIDPDRSRIYDLSDPPDCSARPEPVLASIYLYTSRPIHKAWACAVVCVCQVPRELRPRPVPAAVGAGAGPPMGAPGDLGGDLALQPGIIPCCHTHTHTELELLLYYSLCLAVSGFAFA